MKRTEQPSIPGIDTPSDGARPAPVKTRRKRAGAPSDTPGFKTTVSAFHDAYVKAYASRPTWGGKQLGSLKRLVKQHGAEEVQKRIALLFERGIDFPRPPWDVAALVVAFDRLVANASPQKPQRVRPSDVLGKVGGK